MVILGKPLLPGQNPQPVEVGKARRQHAQQTLAPAERKEIAQAPTGENMSLSVHEPFCADYRGSTNATMTCLMRCRFQV